MTDIVERLRQDEKFSNQSREPKSKRLMTQERREAASEILRLRSERDRLREALEIAVREASILHQNSVGCARNHYGEDPELFGLPPWLADSEKRIALARTALSPACPEAPPASTSRSTSAGKGGDT